MAFIDTFAKYHTLSKYPVDENTSLANVRNKSGHTVTTGDIWSSKIPAFFVVYDDDTRNSLAAEEGDLCKQGSVLYEYKNGAWSARNALVDGEEIGGVIKYHKGCKAVILTDTNNSGTGGNGYSVRIRPNGAAATDPFIDSFISSMDKVVNGIPSVGYDPVVHDTTSSTGFSAEGTASNEYIANCYGGVITFNTKRNQVDSIGKPIGNNAEITITIDCFEYIGERLDATIGNLSETVKDIVDVSLGEVVANIDTTDAASNAGLSVIDTNETGAGSKTSPQIAFTEGSITDTETKLVSGKTVKKYVDDEIDEHRIWDLNDYLVKNIHLDWVQEAIRFQGHHPYGSTWDLQYVFIPNAKSLYSLKENDVWLTQNSARHRAAADAWINDVLTNGTPKVQLVFGNKDSYATANLIRRMFWQMDKDAGLQYGSENSYSRRYLKPGLQVKFNTILDDGTARDPFTSNERINAESLDDSKSNAVQGYVIYTWTGPRKGADANYGINFVGLADDKGNIVVPEVPTITPDGTWWTHRFQDSIDTPYNWSYTVTENEIKFVQSNSYKALQQVANKLDGIVLSDASKAAGLSVVTEGEGYSKTTPGIDLTTGSVASGETKLVSGGTVASAIDTAVKITGIQVKVGSGTAQTLTPINKVVTIEIPEVQAATVTGGVITTDGFAKASDAKAIAEKAISTALAATGSDTLGGRLSAVEETASTAIQTVKVNGTALTATDNAVNIVLPKVLFEGSSHGFTVSTREDVDGGGSNNHYIKIASAEYDANTKSWGVGTTGYFTTASTVESFVNATVGADLTALENKVNAYHKAGVSYKVYTGSPLPDLSIEDNVKEYKNVILLVPKAQDSSYTPPSAISGDYTEYLCVNKGTEEAPQWVWEQIGTTAADLHDYVKAITVNGVQKYTDKNAPNYLELGSFAETVASGQATTLANQGSVYANIATNGTLTLGVASATDSVMGVSKMFTGNLSTDATDVTDTAVSVKSVQGMYNRLAALANSHVVSVDSNSDKTVLTGFSLDVSTNPSNEVEISVKHGAIKNGSLPVTAKVVANGLIDGTDAIDTEKIALDRSAGDNPLHDFIPTGAALTTWIGDMPNLQCGYYLFAGCAALKSFCGDLSSVTDGCNMFYGCSQLTSFTADLSSLTNGTSMFEDTNLSLESVDCIADTINEHEGDFYISWETLPAESERQALVDELSRIVDKGWTLHTNPELLPLLDSEKYKTGSLSVQPLDPDSEPQTVYYVVKK